MCLTGLSEKLGIPKSTLVRMKKSNILKRWRCALKPKLTWPLLAWPFHILLDFPFHTKEFFPVQLFWPLTSLSVDGISWSHPAVWYPNVAGIIMLFIFRYKKNLFNKL